MMVEVYKCLNNVSPPFTWDSFKKNEERNYLNQASAEQKLIG